MSNHAVQVGSLADITVPIMPNNAIQLAANLI